MDQRRLLLAFALSLLLLIGYQELVVRRFHKPHPAAPVAEQSRPQPPPEAPIGGHALAAPVPQATPVRVDNDVIQAAITPVGARLADVRLKKYRGTVDPNSEPLDLVKTDPVLPLTVDLGGGASDAGVIYRPAATDLTLRGDQRADVRFEGELPTGIRLEKRYTFTGDKYLFELSLRLSGERVPQTVGLIFTPIPPDRPGDTSQSALALAGHSLVQKGLPDLAQEQTPLTPAVWGGFAAQYFLAAGAAANPPSSVLMTSADGIPVVRVDAPVTNGEARFVVFFGPKDRAILAQTDYSLDRALDFGWFWFVAIPLLQALRILHGVTGNYGLAIIILTTLVKLATIPLTRATFRNMREMQKIQPQMAKLRERFKDDQVALQKEMMELYRRHRVNPLSGCLPMLLQLPIFVGLYNTLSHAIELRHAPFALWINDLSAPDRLPMAGIEVPVLTLLMGASMFLQTWMTPQQGDPMQQRMMLFMPLVFTFMFINFPSGLVLYWLVNNILTIAQQYFMMRSAA